jgi:3-dehydrosphinganine reductase
MNYEGKKVLITGGSRGIGLAIAKLMATRGADISILARDIERIQTALKEIRESCQTDYQTLTGLPVDVTQETKLNTEISHWINKNGAPDIVVNSAGFAHPGEIVDLSSELFHKTMDVNYFGTINTIKAVLPSMLSKGSGTIVNISSAGGFMGIYGYTAYSGSKFAVTGFTDALRNELKPQGIQVSIVFPPDTDTEQLKYESQFKPAITREVAGTAGLMSPDKVAEYIVKGIDRHKYVITPGFETKMIYWLHNFLGEFTFSVLDYLTVRAWKKQKEVGKENIEVEVK